MDPSIDPMDVCARESLEPNGTENVEGRGSERGYGGNGLKSFMVQFPCTVLYVMRTCN